jgi:hypothetical protein
MFVHKARNPAPTGSPAFFLQSNPDPRGTIAMPVALMDFADIRQQSLIFGLTGADWSFPPGIISGHRNIERGT